MTRLHVPIQLVCGLASQCNLRQNWLYTPTDNRINRCMKGAASLVTNAFPSCSSICLPVCLLHTCLSVYLAFCFPQYIFFWPQFYLYYIFYLFTSWSFAMVYRQLQTSMWLFRIQCLAVPEKLKVGKCWVFFVGCTESDVNKKCVLFLFSYRPVDSFSVSCLCLKVHVSLLPWCAFPPLHLLACYLPGSLPSNLSSHLSIPLPVNLSPYLPSC